MSSENDESNFIKFQARLRPNMVAALDAEAQEIGISRMALIQVILHNHLKSAVIDSEVTSQAELDGTVGFPELRHRSRGVGFHG